METAEAHYIGRHTTTAEQGATVVQPNEDANFEKFVDQILPRLLRLGGICQVK